MTTLNDTLARYFKEKTDVVAAYLFGSHARGKPRPTSDVDIAVLFERHNRGFYQSKRQKMHLELSRLTRKDMDVVIMNTANLILLRQVLSEGLCLAVNDEERLAVFKMITISEIADFAYYHAPISSSFVNKVLGA